MENTIAALQSEITAPSLRTIPVKSASSIYNRIALGAVLALSVFMNFFQLGQNGYGNLYYAAGVKSMNGSWQNFFFVSLDPGGFVSLDKPPLGFWLQTLSTKFFGFTAFSLFFPQALSGVAAVLLLYYLVRRHFGAVAGLIAALALAVSPISVVTSRNNTIDETLVLVLLCAAWAIIHAAETGQLRWLLLSGIFVGIGFNVKMAQAYLIIPALVTTYLLCAPRKIWTRIWHLTLFAVVVLTLSLSWLLAVDLTPTTQRPYVGSTPNNSALGLAFGYNGLNRWRIGADENSSNTGNSGKVPNAAQPTQDGDTVFEAGAPGLLRIFSVALGGQIAWLLPFALLAILALAWQRRFHFQTDRQQLGLVLWGMWLLTTVTFFTLSSPFHQYYMTTIAPGLSALVGIGLVIMWQDYRRSTWRSWLLPLALVVTAGAQIYMLTSYPIWSQWLSPLIGILTALVVIALIVLRLRPRFQSSASAARIAGIAVSIGLFTLLIAPTIWSGYSVIRNTSSSNPTAGPDTAANVVAPSSTSTNVSTTASNEADSALISYLEANQGKAKFLVAVPNANSGAALILTRNMPVMVLGGFSGNDIFLTTNDLQKLINTGTVRFFLLKALPSTQGQTPKISSAWGGQQSALSIWVRTHCPIVPAKTWQSPTSHTNPDTRQLYDCASFRQS